MTEFRYKTRGNTAPTGKPRVYFTCHPEDFDRYFEQISEQIFETQDCDIYYTADMTAEMEEAYRDTDLERMNLFVIPVTFRLLSQPNRAMTSDFIYAKERHIPILPLMMEPGINAYYDQPDKFAKM